jgi:hypothetical protein
MTARDDSYWIFDAATIASRSRRPNFAASADPGKNVAASGWLSRSGGSNMPTSRDRDTSK